MGNGVSAAAAASLVGDSPFVLTMVDHIVSLAAVEGLLASPPSAGQIKLAVDFAKKSVFDLDDATKVSLADDRITAIGKDLSSYHAVDTGLFYCTPALFSGIRRAVANGRYSLSAGISECILQQRVHAVDVTGHPWIDVDTPEAHSEAKRRVEAGLVKSTEDGFVARALNRPVSARLSRLLLRTRLTPNQVTVASFLLAMMGAAALATADSRWWIAAGLLIQLASIVDGCDGEIARAKLLQSNRGAWFDTLMDRYADIGIGIAITFAAHSLSPSPWIWPVGMLAVVSFLLASYVTKEYQLRFGRAFPDTFASRLKRRDLRLLILAAGAVLGHPFVGLIVAGAMTHGVILSLIASTWRRESQRFGKTIFVPLGAEPQASQPAGLVEVVASAAPSPDPQPLAAHP
jgi:CDP-L-myo-inositol myo-inositolphosphotransferase